MKKPSEKTRRRKASVKANVAVTAVAQSADPSALAQARAQWLFGDWDALASADLPSLAGHPDRDRLALLMATAWQQLGRHEEASRATRQAIAWGCNTRFVAQILVAGVHNTLGRAAALAGRQTKAIEHFRASVAMGASTGGGVELMGHARSVREIAKLGLLPQAAALMEQSLEKASDLSERPGHTRARLKMLESEMELLRGHLLMAAQREATGARSMSQLGQDRWVLETLGQKRGGFFVEVGATDGVLLSNTYLLEKGFGWSGICVEPHPGFFRQLKANRECIASDACIAGESGREVEFILADEFGGIADFADADSHSGKRNAFRALGKTLRMTTTSLHDLLVAHGAPHDIDYLSLDTEGSEFEILRRFPFDRWRIRCLTVEHNYTDARESIRKLLEPLGYRRKEAQWDDWYVLEEAAGSAADDSNGS